MKPTPPLPPDCCVASIKQKPYALRKRHGPDAYEREAAAARNPLPLRYHAVKNFGQPLNWGCAGVEITAVQAMAICGAKPNPRDPVVLNKHEREKAKWIAGRGDIEPPKLYLKYWVQDLYGIAVNCPRCLAMLRKTMRPRLRYRPGIKAVPIKPWRGDAGYYGARVVADWGDDIWYEK
jgi:hypothetical protein